MYKLGFQTEGEWSCVTLGAGPQGECGCMHNLQCENIIIVFTLIQSSDAVDTGEMGKRANDKAQ